MEKFRIIKIEKINGNGESNCYYRIQKKRIGLFFDYQIITHYYTYTDWNAGFRGEPVHAACLIKRLFDFDSFELAKECVDKLNTPFSLKYKGNKIIRVFDDRKLTNVFINKSFYRCVGSTDQEFGYEHAKTLEELKKMIDSREIKTKISVCDGKM